ncbi:Sucrose symporter plant [Penicillium malachiteum]|uniref:Sucrose symporter plant n=1 Tax=Penicillium malachiteum TaxID=1324776 RepID=A0AAD6HKB2_9EURO|nr:Sucrose symporter plant [Penicillium malachiteum]
MTFMCSTMLAAFQLFHGKVYGLFQVQWVYLTALFIFELGSLVCGVASNSITLIVARAVAGLGSAGMFTGALVTLAHTVEVEKRPLFFSMLGGMYGIASVAGPLWGGVTYDWSNERIIALFVIFGLVIIAFIALQIVLGDKATVPTDIACQRTVAFASFFGLCIGGSFFIMIYYIPIWVGELYLSLNQHLLIRVHIRFQALHGVSAVRSGINSLPMILSNVFGIVLAGGLTTRFGYYTPFSIASSITMSIGAGLISTFTVDQSQAKWVGFLFLYGLGVGFGFQQGGIAAQAVLPLSKVPIGTAIVMFLQMLGGSLFVSVAQNIFTKELISNLAALNIPNFSPLDVVNGGQQSDLPRVLVAYNDTLVKVFQISLIMGCLSIIGALGIKWRRVAPKRIN